MNAYSVFVEKSVSGAESTERRSRNVDLSSYVFPIYGDSISGLITSDISGKQIDITDRNKRFKFVKIVQPKSLDSISPDNFVWISELVSTMNSKETDYFFVIASHEKPSTSQAIKLTYLQEKTGIRIVVLQRQKVLDSLNIPDCGCGYLLLLDRFNKIRLSIYNIEIETIKKITQREILEIFPQITVK